MSALAGALVGVSTAGVFLFTEYLRSGPALGETSAYAVAGGEGISEDRFLLETQVLTARVIRQDFDQAFAHVDVIDLETGQARRLMPSACGFGYRDSVFKHELAGRVLVVAVAFRLSLQPAVQARYAELNAELQAQGIEAPTPQQVFEAVCAVRRRKLPEPAVLGNAGSFFKNPVVDFEQATRLRAAHPELVSYPQPDGRVKLAAGWLIERCGWKGRALGRAGVYERQALVLVNHGGATGAEVLALAEAIRADVRTRFGVALEMEPVRMGG